MRMTEEALTDSLTMPLSSVSLLSLLSARSTSLSASLSTVSIGLTISIFNYFLFVTMSHLCFLAGAGESVARA